MIRKFLAAFVLIFFVASTTTFAEGNIDWERGIIRVTGEALGPDNLDKRDSFYKNLARQGARLDAFAKLAELITGLQNDVFGYESDVHDNAIRTFMEFEFPQGQVKQIDMSVDEEGICRVILEINIFGEGSVSNIIFAPLKNEPKLSFPKPRSNVNLNAAKYTGLIIDCSGLPLNPVASPAIKNTNGQIFYGHKFINYDKIVSSGIVAYGKGNIARAGNNPLIVKAVALHYLNSYAVVSVADADKILAANQRDKFLENCAVVIVY